MQIEKFTQILNSNRQWFSFYRRDFNSNWLYFRWIFICWIPNNVYKYINQEYKKWDVRLRSIKEVFNIILWMKILRDTQVTRIFKEIKF